MQIDFGVTEKIYAITTQGRSDQPQWVKTYRLAYSGDSKKFYYYSGVSSTHRIWPSQWVGQWVDCFTVQTFSGNVDQNTKRKNYLRYYVSAQSVKIFPLTWQQMPAMRVELYGCSGTNLFPPPLYPMFSLVLSPSPPSLPCTLSLTISPLHSLPHYLFLALSPSLYLPLSSPFVIIVLLFAITITISPHKHVLYGSISSICWRLPLVWLPQVLLWYPPAAICQAPRCSPQALGLTTPTTAPRNAQRSASKVDTHMLDSPDPGAPVAHTYVSRDKIHSLELFDLRSDVTVNTFYSDSIHQVVGVSSATTSVVATRTTSAVVTAQLSCRTTRLASVWLSAPLVYICLAILTVRNRCLSVDLDQNWE